MFRAAPQGATRNRRTGRSGSIPPVPGPRQKQTRTVWQRADIGPGYGNASAANLTVSSTSAPPAFSPTTVASFSSGETFTLSSPGPSRSTNASSFVALSCTTTQATSTGFPLPLPVSTSGPVSTAPVCGPVNTFSPVIGSPNSSAAPILSIGNSLPSGTLDTTLTVTLALSPPAGSIVQSGSSTSLLSATSTASVGWNTGSPQSAAPTLSSSATSTTSVGWGTRSSQSAAPTSSSTTNPTGGFSTVQNSWTLVSSTAALSSLTDGGQEHSTTISSTTIPTFPTGSYGVGSEPSTTISFSLFFPGSGGTTTGGSTATGTSAGTPFFATSGATSRSRSQTSIFRFANNRGGVIGVAFSATFVLFLGILAALFACRRVKHSQTRNISALSISPPLLQGEDGLADAYSPVGRRRPRRPRDSAEFLRPLSFQSLDIPSAADIPADGLESSAHYDTDTWGTAPTSPTVWPVVSSSPSMIPLPPQDPSPSVALPVVPHPSQPGSVGAKGFMRRLRRGRPSMASRGLLTTLAPVPESPTTVMSVAETSRPPSSMHGLLVDPSVPVWRPAPANYSLPWIHRTRGSVSEVP
ncbi:hypothetical protein DFH07DRAFT_770478 [Mycena maculata]|uniref:Transmembrane protein n=1 Tax=Mycena maculata TaxID=230809 RepID=A0AAD7JH36_9AGAR|nr:hypothetical protein DFH07DRAFT_770478 [Mycena maculata]